MINLYKTQSASSFVMYPEDTPFSASTAAHYKLSVSQSLDQSNSLITVNRLNTRYSSNWSNVLVLSTVDSTQIPTASGQYQAELLYQAGDKAKWGIQHTLFGTTNALWSNVSQSYYSGSVISTDRAYVFGTNEQTITEYTGSDQIGKYITYNS
jgi:hypothetical protein